MIVDASVALKWFLTEPQNDEARQLIMRQDLMAPDLLFPEVLNGLRKAVRDNRIDAPTAKAAMSSLELAVPTIVPVSLVAERSLDLSISLQHPIYDCIYLALAVEMNAVLVTADAMFQSLVSPTSWGASIELLGEL